MLCKQESHSILCILLSMTVILVFIYDSFLKNLFGMSEWRIMFTQNTWDKNFFKKILSITKWFCNIFSRTCCNFGETVTRLESVRYEPLCNTWANLYVVSLSRLTSLFCYLLQDVVFWIFLILISFNLINYLYGAAWIILWTVISQQHVILALTDTFEENHCINDA